jgi:hypothetical protein
MWMAMRTAPIRAWDRRDHGGEVSLAMIAGRRRPENVNPMVLAASGNRVKMSVTKD